MVNTVWYWVDCTVWPKTTCNLHASSTTRSSWTARTRRLGQQVKIFSYVVHPNNIQNARFWKSGCKEPQEVANVATRSPGSYRVQPQEGVSSDHTVNLQRHDFLSNICYYDVLLSTMVMFHKLIYSTKYFTAVSFCGIIIKTDAEALLQHQFWSLDIFVYGNQLHLVFCWLKMENSLNSKLWGFICRQFSSYLCFVMG